MQRVAVVGNSGSGKSTLARAIAARIGAEHTELDAIFHQAGWKPLPAAEFASRIDTITATERWVIDGNYSGVQPIIFGRADTVVWVDPPRHRMMRQIIGRSFGRVSRREELWNGNREGWANLLSVNPENSVIIWAWRKHSEIRAKYATAMADPANQHLTFIRLRSRPETVAFLRQIDQSLVR